MGLFTFMFGDEEVRVGEGEEPTASVDVNSLKPLKDNSITVKSGDTLGAIAAKAGSSVQELAKLNGIKDVNKISVGQKIKLPAVDSEPEPEEDLIIPAEEKVQTPQNIAVATTPSERLIAEAERAARLQPTQGLAGSQAVLNFVGSLNPFAGDKTEQDYKPEVIGAVKEAAINALKQGRMNIDYEDYGVSESGVSARGLVSSSEGREEAGGLSGLSRGLDAVADAALSIGGGTLVEEDGEVFLTDVYDFSPIDKDKITDAYSMLRWAMGELSEAGFLNKFKTKIRLGSKEELLPEPEKVIVKVKRGDNLSKIAKANGTTVQELMEKNNIKDANKLSVGQELEV